MKTLCMFIGMVLVTSSVCASKTLPNAAKSPSYGPLIDALIIKESSGNDTAIGDKHLKDMAYGPLQVRRMCLADVNSRYGTSYRLQDMLGNRRLSAWVCQKYLEMYATRKALGREPTDEDRARIWNGGPSGWKKESTKGYWSVVKGILARNNKK